MRKIISIFVLFAFLINGLMPASSLAQEITLPKPGDMVYLSPSFTPAYLKGMVIHPNDPFKFDFIIHRGDTRLSLSQKQEEYTKLIKYFLAALAVPDEEQWVNLSPYEKNRIIPDTFGLTVMGRDLLSEDYLLKQITASMIYPQDIIGKEFWQEVYSKAQAKYGTTDIPINTFNKVWIVPEKAVLYEKGNTVYVLQSHLKVMLEEDYLSLNKHIQPSHLPGMGQKTVPPPGGGISTLGSQVIRTIVIPELTREVNEDKNFAPLRQVFSGMLLATWYKKALKVSILGKLYADQGKVKGVDQDPKNNQKIYDQYLRAFKKGVFNLIKEDTDRYTQQTIPRKYFSGGMSNRWLENMTFISRAQISDLELDDLAMAKVEPPSAAMLISIAPQEKGSKEPMEITLGDKQELEGVTRQGFLIQIVGTLNRQLPVRLKGKIIVNFENEEFGLSHNPDGLGFPIATAIIQKVVSLGVKFQGDTAMVSSAKAAAVVAAVVLGLVSYVTLSPYHPFIPNDQEKLVLKQNQLQALQNQLIAFDFYSARKTLDGMSKDRSVTKETTDLAKKLYEDAMLNKFQTEADDANFRSVKIYLNSEGMKYDLSRGYISPEAVDQAEHIYRRMFWKRIPGDLFDGSKQWKSDVKILGREYANPSISKDKYLSKGSGTNSKAMMTNDNIKISALDMKQWQSAVLLDFVKRIPAILVTPLLSYAALQSFLRLPVDKITLAFPQMQGLILRLSATASITLGSTLILWWMGELIYRNYQSSDLQDVLIRLNDLDPALNYFEMKALQAIVRPIYHSQRTEVYRTVERGVEKRYGKLEGAARDKRIAKIFLKMDISTRTVKPAIPRNLRFGWRRWSVLFGALAASAASPFIDYNVFVNPKAAPTAHVLRSPYVRELSSGVYLSIDPRKGSSIYSFRVIPGSDINLDGPDQIEAFIERYKDQTDHPSELKEKAGKGDYVLSREKGVYHLDFFINSAMTVKYWFYPPKVFVSGSTVEEWLLNEVDPESSKIAFYGSNGTPKSKSTTNFTTALDLVRKGALSIRLADPDDQSKGLVIVGQKVDLANSKFGQTVFPEPSIPLNSINLSFELPFEEAIKYVRTKPVDLPWVYFFVENTIDKVFSPDQLLGLDLDPGKKVIMKLRPANSAMTGLPRQNVALMPNFIEFAEWRLANRWAIFRKFTPGETYVYNQIKNGLFADLKTEVFPEYIWSRENDPIPLAQWRHFRAEFMKSLANVRSKVNRSLLEARYRSKVIIKPDDILDDLRNSYLQHLLYHEVGKALDDATSETALALASSLVDEYSRLQYKPNWVIMTGILKSLIKSGSWAMVAGPKNKNNHASATMMSYSPVHRLINIDSLTDKETFEKKLLPRLEDIDLHGNPDRAMSALRAAAAMALMALSAPQKVPGQTTSPGGNVLAASQGPVAKKFEDLKYKTGYFSLSPDLNLMLMPSVGNYDEYILGYPRKLTPKELANALAGALKAYSQNHAEGVPRQGDLTDAMKGLNEKDMNKSSQDGYFYTVIKLPDNRPLDQIEPQPVSEAVFSDHTKIKKGSYTIHENNGKKIKVKITGIMLTSGFEETKRYHFEFMYKGWIYRLKEVDSIGSFETKGSMIIAENPPDHSRASLEKLNPGGIDMNAANLDLQIRRDGNGVPLPVSQQNMENIHIDGLVPVILEIRPAASSPVLSELTTPSPARATG